jgi:hypothetical protein
MQLTGAWAVVFEAGEESLDMDFLGMMMRLAYVQGYQDAVTEPEAQRGQLMEQLGYAVPPRRSE